MLIFIYSQRSNNLYQRTIKEQKPAFTNKKNRSNFY